MSEYRLLPRLLGPESDAQDILVFDPTENPSRHQIVLHPEAAFRVQKTS